MFSNRKLGTTMRASGYIDVLAAIVPFMFTTMTANRRNSLLLNNDYGQNNR
jgi:hypothetical protein